MVSAAEHFADSFPRHKPFLSLLEGWKETKQYNLRLKLYWLPGKSVFHPGELHWWSSNWLELEEVNAAFTHHCSNKRH